VYQLEIKVLVIVDVRCNHDNYLRSFIIYTIHQILFGWYNQEEWM